MRVTIQGVDHHVKYEVEVAGREVLEGRADGGPIVVAQFKMPDLGGSEKTVVAEIEVKGSGPKTKVKQNLKYLGRAQAPLPLPVPDTSEDTPHETPAPAPPVLPTAAQAPASAPAPVALNLVPAAAPAPSAKAPRARGPHQAAKQRRPAARPSHKARAHKKPKRHTAAKKRRHRRNAARTAPLFDGVPEGGASAPAEKGGYAAPNASSPPVATVAYNEQAARAARLSIALLVPGLLAIAAVSLAGATLHRRRRLAARGRR